MIQLYPNDLVEIDYDDVSDLIVSSSLYSNGGFYYSTYLGIGETMYFTAKGEGAVIYLLPSSVQEDLNGISESGDVFYYDNISEDSWDEGSSEWDVESSFVNTTGSPLYPIFNVTLYGVEALTSSSIKFYFSKNSATTSNTETVYNDLLPVVVESPIPSTILDEVSTIVDDSRLIGNFSNLIYGNREKVDLFENNLFDVYSSKSIPSLNVDNVRTIFWLNYNLYVYTLSSSVVDLGDFNISVGNISGPTSSEFDIKILGTVTILLYDYDYYDSDDISFDTTIVAKVFDNGVTSINTEVIHVNNPDGN